MFSTLTGLFRLKPVRSVLPRLLTAVIVCLAVATQPVLAADNEIFDVRFGVKGTDKTRIVLDLTADTKYRASVRQDEQGQKFLAVDLAKTTFNIAGTPSESGIGKGIGLMGSYAWSTTLTGRGQVLFSLNETAIPTSVFMLKPKGGNKHYRLVIDMSAVASGEFESAIGKKFGALDEAPKPATQAQTQTQAKAQTKVPATARPGAGDGREAPFGVAPDTARQIAIAAAEKAQQASPSANSGSAGKIALTRVENGIPLPRRKPSPAALEAADGRFTIVIDPGHGGKHPGSVGQAGLVEKTVTLASAKTLKKMLQKRGYRVLLTRDGDKYVDLPDRMEFARDNEADLFLSIHADGNSDKTIRGASVYTLSDKGSVRLARQSEAEGDFHLYKKDISKVSANPDARAIVFDMAARDSKNKSSRFANLLIGALDGEILMLNNTHRQANYKVLLSPDVPAVLLELAFVSNTQDEKNLNSRTWRTKAMRSVADSIDAYFEDVKPQKQAMNAGGSK